MAWDTIKCTLCGKEFDRTVDRSWASHMHTDDEWKARPVEECGLVRKWQTVPNPKPETEADAIQRFDEMMGHFAPRMPRPGS